MDAKREALPEHSHKGTLQHVPCRCARMECMGESRRGNVAQPGEPSACRTSCHFLPLYLAVHIDDGANAEQAGGALTRTHNHHCIQEQGRSYFRCSSLTAARSISCH